MDLLDSEKQSQPRATLLVAFVRLTDVPPT